MIMTAVALSAGEEVPGIIAVLERHPSVELCGISRSVGDLFRLLTRFAPSLLIASPGILEEVVQEGLTGEGAHHMSDPVTFLLREGRGTEEGVGLERIMQLPVRIAGLVERECDEREIDRVFQYIKAKLEIYNCACDSHTSRNTNGSEGGFLVFSGCKGGVGTTLLSCSFAAVAASGSRRVLLMEMGGNHSQLTYIKSNVEGKTLYELSPMAEEVSWDLLRISLFRHPCGFYLLPTGRRNAGGKGVASRNAAPLLRNLLFLFDVVVMDLRDPWSGDLSLVNPFSPLIHLVTLPDVLSAACARDAAELLRRTGMDMSRLRLLVNRRSGNHLLGLEEISRATGLGIAAVLPEDPRSGLDFAELGEVPRPESPLGRAVASLAAGLGLASTGHAGTMADGRSRRKGRFRGNGPPVKVRGATHGWSAEA